MFADFRKLVLLKLEKGYNFGDDAILDGSSTDRQMGQPKTFISTSIFKEMKDKEKKICVVGTKPILEGYEKYWTAEKSNVNIQVSESRKSSMEKACNSAFHHDMTLCHIDMEGLDEDKKVQKAKKWTKKLWEHTSTNGLFVTVWTGSAVQKAFVGIALNKAEIE